MIALIKREYLSLKKLVPLKLLIPLYIAIIIAGLIFQKMQYVLFAISFSVMFLFGESCRRDIDEGWYKYVKALPVKVIDYILAKFISFTAALSAITIFSALSIVVAQETGILKIQTGTSGLLIYTLIIFLAIQSLLAVYHCINISAQGGKKAQLYFMIFCFAPALISKVIGPAFKEFCLKAYWKLGLQKDLNKIALVLACAVIINAICISIAAINVKTKDDYYTI